MTGTWGYEVGEEEEVEEYALRPEDHSPHEESWLTIVQECEQVKALVVCFFEEGFNPGVVTLQTTEGMQVPYHARRHARHTSNGLEEYEPR